MAQAVFRLRFFYGGMIGAAALNASRGITSNDATFQAMPASRHFLIWRKVDGGVPS